MSVEKLDMGSRPDPLRVIAEYLPRPLRFLGVGAIGLTTDIGVFTILIGTTPRPLLMRLFSLAAATLVTWRLNRALTFDRSGRRQHDEAMRYAAVTALSEITRPLVSIFERYWRGGSRQTGAQVQTSHWWFRKDPPKTPMKKLSSSRCCEASFQMWVGSIDLAS